MAILDDPNWLPNGFDYEIWDCKVGLKKIRILLSLPFYRAPEIFYIALFGFKNSDYRGIFGVE